MFLWTLMPDLCPRMLTRSAAAVNVIFTLQLRHEVPTEVDLAATSFKGAVDLIPGDALSIAGEPLTAATAQLKPKV